MKTKIQDFEVTVPNLEGTAIAERVKVQIPVRFSEEIGEWVLTPEAHDIIDSTKARYMGLLLPGQFKALRTKLQLSQKEMGELFQAGEKSWTRWESGSQRPSRSISLLIRAVYEGVLPVSYLKQAGKTPLRANDSITEDANSLWVKVLNVPLTAECGPAVGRGRRDVFETVVKGIQSFGKCATSPVVFNTSRLKSSHYSFVTVSNQNSANPAQLSEVS